MRKFFALLAAAAVAFSAASGYCADKPKRDPDEVFKKLDKDNDGALTEVEFIGKREGEMAAKAKTLFAAKDTNKDGKLSLEEFKAKKAK